MSVTIEQLRAEIEDHYEDRDVNVWNELEWDLGSGLELKSGRELKFVYQEGGEGEGDTYFYVFSTGEDEDEQLFRVDGYYASWDGTTYDDYGDILKEVQAVIVPVVQYHAK